MPATGAAVLATWYDLAPAVTQGHLDWLHGTYLPCVLRRDGYRWAAHYRTVSDMQLTDADGDDGILSHTRQMGVSADAAPELGRGSRYLLLVGGDDVATFMEPLHAALDAAMDDECGRRLAQRDGERTFVLQDLVCRAGKGAAFAGDGPAPRIQMGTLRTEPGADVDLWRWYLRERLPLMTELPGVVQTRIMAGAVGWAKMAVMYEFVDADAHAMFRARGEKETIANAATGGTLFPMSRVHQAPFGPTVADRIWPPA